MPTKQSLSLTVNQPAANATVKLNQPFSVTGVVLDQGPPEPRPINSVTVQVDGGPVIRAALTHIVNKTATEVSFHASAQVTGGQDPHIVVVTATDDLGSVKQTKQVFTGTPFAVDAPAVTVDVLSAIPFDPFKILGQTAPIQKGLSSLSDSLHTIGKIIAGPNFQFFNSPDLSHPSRLRMGVWIEDPSFPVITRDGLTLPVLSDQAAALGFNQVPPVPVPDLAAFTASFGLSVPLRTLQKLVDAIAQDVKDAASAQGVTLDALTVQTISPESVATHFSGHLPLDVPFDMTVTEVLGLKQLSDATPMVPAVVSSSHSSGLGNVLDLIIAAIFRPFLAALAVEFVELRSTASDADQQITGLMQPLVAGIPPRFPFRNTLLPIQVPNPPDFPTMVLQWKSFRATTAGLLGSGLLTIEARDQSEVALSINGPHAISGTEGELAGNVRIDYSFSLSNLAPDEDKFTWHVSGAGTRGGKIDSTLGLGGTFTVDFPLPLRASGKYAFTLTVTGTETSGTAGRTPLSASASMAVVFDIKSTRQPRVRAEGSGA